MATFAMLGGRHDGGDVQGLANTSSRRQARRAASVGGRPSAPWDREEASGRKQGKHVVPGLAGSTSTSAAAGAATGKRATPTIGRRANPPWNQSTRAAPRRRLVSDGQAEAGILGTRWCPPQGPPTVRAVDRTPDPAPWTKEGAPRAGKLSGDPFDSPARHASATVLLREGSRETPADHGRRLSVRARQKSLTGPMLCDEKAQSYTLAVSGAGPVTRPMKKGVDGAAAADTAGMPSAEAQTRPVGRLHTTSPAASASADPAASPHAGKNTSRTVDRSAHSPLWGGGGSGGRVGRTGGGGAGVGQPRQQHRRAQTPRARETVPWDTFDTPKTAARAGARAPGTAPWLKESRDERQKGVSTTARQQHMAQRAWEGVGGGGRTAAASRPLSATSSATSATSTAQPSPSGSGLRHY